MDRPVACGEGCEAGTLVRFESDGGGAVEVAVGIDPDALSAIALGTDVRVNVHEGLEVRRVSDDALIVAVLEDHAPGFRADERVPRRSFGSFAVEAEAESACQGYTHAASWSCTKLYAVDALAVLGADNPLRLEPGDSATFATEDGTFFVRHRYGAHRIALSPESSCAPCADREPAVLSYEVVRVD